MPNVDRHEQDGDLPPPGTRWGSGAQSVLPYLTKSLQAKPFHTPEPGEQRPRDPHAVFTNWPPSRPS
jgi:hypothetical protein